MRPSKRILLLSTRDAEAGPLAFVLATKAGLKVTKAGTDRTFEALLRSDRWDLVIIPHLLNHRNTAHKCALVRRLGGCRVLILTWEKGCCPPLDTGASAVLPYGASNAEIIDRVRILTAAKRGPKPQCKPVQPGAALQSLAEVA